MSKKEIYTKEQIEEMKDFFRENDFTADMAVERKCSLEGKEAEFFVKSKNFFRGYWNKILKLFDITRNMANFSKDHPVNFIQNADADYFSKTIAKIMADKDSGIFGKYMEKFFEMYEEPLTIGFKGYAQQLGKDPDDLTEEEIMYVSEVFEEIAYNLQSEEYIECLKQLVEKYPNIPISDSVETAESFL